MLPVHTLRSHFLRRNLMRLTEFHNKLNLEYQDKILNVGLNMGPFNSKRNITVFDIYVKAEFITKRMYELC